MIESLNELGKGRGVPTFFRDFLGGGGTEKSPPGYIFDQPPPWWNELSSKKDRLRGWKRGEQACV